jgi:hypothetical protein
MAGENPLSFIFGGTAPTPSYDELVRRREIAKALASRARAFPKTAGEGLTYLGEAMGDVIGDYRLRGAERAFGAKEDAAVKELRGATYGNPASPLRPQAAPEAAPPTAAPTAAAPSENTFAGNPITLATPRAVPADTERPAPEGVEAFFGSEPMAPPRTATLAPAGGPVSGPTTANATTAPADAEEDPIWQRRKAAIGKIESNVRGDPYAAVGSDVVRKDGSTDRAYGRFQVMGANIPEWTEQAGLGRMSPQQFLLDKKAQDAVFKHRFGQYVDKYGEEGAARAWYAGEGGMNNLNKTDQHGRLTVGGYGRDYTNNLRNGVTQALVDQQAPQGGGAVPGPTQAGPQEAPGTSPRAGGEAPYRVASLPPGAGGTMSDANAEQPTPTTITPGPGSVPPGAGGVRIAPAPPAGALAQASPGAPGALATDENALPMGAPPPQRAPGPTSRGPAALNAVGGSTPSLEPIPPASEQKMDAPGPRPPPPPVLPYSPAQERALAIMQMRGASPYLKEVAKQQFDREEGFRKQLTERREADYVNEREKHEAKVLAYEKFTREREERRIKQLTDRTTLENMRADLEEKYFKQGIPRTQAIQKADLEIQQAKRTLEKADEHVINGVIWHKPPGTLTWSTAPGSPTDEKMTEKQMQTMKFLQRGAAASGIVGDGNVLRGFRETQSGKVPIVGNYTLTPEYRAQRSAADTWMMAVLRDESGAVISENEMARKYGTYFPQPGDDDKTVAQKTARRRYEERSLYESLGDKRNIMDKWYQERATRKAEGVPEGTVQRSPSTGKVRRVIGGHWEYD